MNAFDLPSFDQLAVFTVASLALIFTPGPDMTFYLGQTLAGGRAHGFAAMLGAFAGLFVHSMLAALGLSALLAASAAAFTALKFLGAIYLLWLAFNAVRHGSALPLRPGVTSSGSLGRIFKRGLAINLLNPKIVMFFLTFLPQFVAASDPHAAAKLLFLGLFFIALGVPCCALLILAAGRLSAVLRRSPRMMRVIDYLFAGVMGAFAARLLLLSRAP
ncbi:MAG: LysE family translocator [Xanthobacteraceae bacterium]